MTKRCPPIEHFTGPIPMIGKAVLPSPKGTLLLGGVMVSKNLSLNMWKSAPLPAKMGYFMQCQESGYREEDALIKHT